VYKLKYTTTTNVCQHTTNILQKVSEKPVRTAGQGSEMSKLFSATAAIPTGQLVQLNKNRT